MPASTSSRRWPRRLLLGLVLIGLLLTAAYVGLSLAFPPARLAALLSEQVTAATGRSFAVRGPSSFRLLPQIGIAAADITLSNAPWGTRDDMLRVKQARFNVALLPLLRGEIEIASANLDGVDLWLETDRQGAGNWVFNARGRSEAQRPDGDAAPQVGLRMRGLEMRDTRLAFRDGRSGQRRDLAVERLALDDDGDGQRLDARLQSGPRRLQLSGRIDPLHQLARGAADWPFDLRLRGDDLDASAKGRLRRGGTLQALEAEVTLRLARTEALAPWVGALPALPMPAEAKGRLNLAGSTLRVDALQLSLAKQAVGGNLSLDTGTPWSLKADLAAEAINLDHWLPPRSTTVPARAAPRPQVFGTAPLGLDALPEAHATLALRVGRLQMSGLPPLSNLNLQMKLEPGRLRAEPLSFGVAGGTLKGLLAVQQNGKAAPRVSLHAQGSGLSLDELLRAANSGDYARGGQVQLRAELESSGNTPHALAAGVSGEVLMSVRDTTLGEGKSPLGSNILPTLLRAMTLRPDLRLSSHIDCAVFRLPLKNGVATIDRSIALETDQLAISAKGELNLGDETLALAFKPTPKHGLKNNPLDLARLVVVKGPWRDPKVELDAKGVAGMAATLGLAGATGGLSLLAQQLLQERPETEVCRAAMSAHDGAPAPERAAPAAKPSTPSPSQPPSLPDALRRLFK